MRTTLHNHHQRRRAAILVLTLWIVGVLTLMAHSLAYEMRIELKLSGLHRDRFVAEKLARLGVARAVADLRNDYLLHDAREADNQQIFDALGDVWARSLTPRAYDVEGPDGDHIGSYELLVVDDSGKFPLNAATERWRQAMTFLLMQLELDEEEARRLADTIWDWQDADDLPVGGLGESEREYYLELALDLDPQLDPDEIEVLPRNNPFSSVEELLVLPGMTSKIFYGYDPQTDDIPFFPDLTARDERDRALGLRDLLTVSSEQLNVNTAGYQVLSAVFAAATQDLDLGRELASALIDHRQGRDTDNLTNETAFLDLGELQEVPGMVPSHIQNAGQVVPLTIQSQSFSIYCRATVGQKRRRARSSATRDERRQAAPRAQVITQCRRGFVPIPQERQDDEILNKYDPADLPAFPPPGQVRETDREGQWRIPVVYLRHWNAF